MAKVVVIAAARVRSYGNKTGLKAFGLAAVLGWYPAAAHCAGLVNPSTGFPRHSGRVIEGWIHDAETVTLPEKGLA
jgi:hypothetical protein